MRPEGEADEFFTFESTSDSTPLSRPSPADPNPPRRPRLWAALIGGAGALAIVAFIVFGMGSDADDDDEPEPVATTAPIPTPPVIDPITPVEISTADQWLAEPTLAWTRTLADFDNALSIRPLLDRLTEFSANSSGTIVVQVQTVDARELAGIDAHTGEILWDFPLGDSVRMCSVLADGHQVGCIKEGATQNYITVLSAKTGQAYGTTNWETDCVAHAVSGTANHLVVAGKSFSEQVPCLAAGALWDAAPALNLPRAPDDTGLPAFFPASTEPDAELVMTEQQSAWEQGFVYVTAADSYVLAKFLDFQVLATADLQHQFSTYGDTTMTISTDLGPAVLAPEFSLNSPTTLSTTAWVLQPVPPALLEDSATAEDANRLLADSVEWQFTHTVSNSRQDVRIGTTLVQQGGKGTMTFSPNHRGEPPGGVTITPDGQTAIVAEVTEAENPLLADYAQTYGRSFTLNTDTLLTAYDTGSGGKLWTTSKNAALVNPIYRGDALVWTASRGIESQVGALDLATGEWRWSIDNKSTQLDISDANWFTTIMVGDVLVRTSNGSIEGLVTTPVTN